MDARVSSSRQLIMTRDEVTIICHIRWEKKHIALSIAQMVSPFTHSCNNRVEHIPTPLKHEELTYLPALDKYLASAENIEVLALSLAMIQVFPQTFLPAVVAELELINLTRLLVPGSVATKAVDVRDVRMVALYRG